ncbi:MAG: 23S rRNA (adenine(2503)-C(2))-methyltransferase RlmN [Proteobacteria bacterium]|nr:23S rRNA (adenine(2503)-C(2))-methyltransferase RlmN [Pseudomonadota bacterium]
MSVAQKENLKGLPLPELEAKLVSLGHPPFRAKQLYRWIYKERETDFEKMTDLSKDFRRELGEKFTLSKIEVSETHPAEDGTIKYLVKLSDGEQVESVFIPTEGRVTLCVSTQVGCKMACTFCATGYQKFVRDLKAWEIVDQLMSVPHPRPITNIVLMGMGEPFDNYEEVMKALKLFNDPLGLKIGKRHITVSTVGITDKIQPFIDASLGKLAISLHGTTDEQRSEIMPINAKFPMNELMEACRNLKFRGTERVTFEYILIKDFNDSDEDAYRLIKLMKGIPCKINLLAYNENPFVDFKRPDEARVLKFQNILLKHHLTTTYRRSRGRDVAAACGQLRIEAENRLKRQAWEKLKGTLPQRSSILEPGLVPSGVLPKAETSHLSNAP